MSETNTVRKIKPYVPEKRKLYRIKELPDILNMSKTNIYNRIKEGNFPAAQKIGGMSVWTPDQIDSWIENELSEKRVKEFENRERRERYQEKKEREAEEANG